MAPPRLMPPQIAIQSAATTVVAGGSGLTVPLPVDPLLDCESTTVEPPEKAMMLMSASVGVPVKVNA